MGCSGSIMHAEPTMPASCRPALEANDTSGDMFDNHLFGGSGRSSASPSATASTASSSFVSNSGHRGSVLSVVRKPIRELV